MSEQATAYCPPHGVCHACGVHLEHLTGVGWVDRRSGDDGGTYDVCPEAYDDQANQDRPHVVKYVIRHGGATVAPPGGTDDLFVDGWAARFQAQDNAVDVPWLTEEGYDVWSETSVAEQERYRRLVRLALSAGMVPGMAR